MTYSSSVYMPLAGWAAAQCLETDAGRGLSGFGHGPLRRWLLIGRIEIQTAETPECTAIRLFLHRCHSEIPLSWNAVLGFVKVLSKPRRNSFAVMCFVTVVKSRGQHGQVQRQDMTDSMTMDTHFESASIAFVSLSLPVRFPLSLVRSGINPNLVTALDTFWA